MENRRLLVPVGSEGDKKRVIRLRLIGPVTLLHNNKAVTSAHSPQLMTYD